MTSLSKNWGMTKPRLLFCVLHILIAVSSAFSVITNGIALAVGADGESNKVQNASPKDVKNSEKNDIEYLNESLKREFTTLSEQLSELKALDTQSAALFKENQEKLNLENAQLNTQIKTLEQQSAQLDKAIAKATENSEFQLEMNDLLLATKQMAKESIGNWHAFYGIKKAKESNIEKSDGEAAVSSILSSIYEAKNIQSLGQGIYSRESSFVTPEGKEAQGTLVHIGAIAAVGVPGAPGETETGHSVSLLAPMGGGKWHSVNAALDNKSALSVFIEANPLKTAFDFVANVPLFTFNDLAKPVVLSEKKTMQDTVSAGGLIGYVILGLGLVALALIILRFFMLYRYGMKQSELDHINAALISDLKADPAVIEKDRRFSQTARKLLKKIVPALNTPGTFREKVSEFLIGEFRSFDRFGSLITVVATVAPLLGLLGTVTGMISTFDLITEYGTGDPKMLSGGISEALVTTMLGLMVAIPALFCGNLLNSWQEKIKKSMQQTILKLSYVTEPIAGSVAEPQIES